MHANGTLAREGVHVNQISTNQIIIERTAHISTLLRSLQTLENLDNTQRLNLLYFSEKTPTTTLNHAASMLVELFKYRDFLIDR